MQVSAPKRIAFPERQQREHSNRRMKKPVKKRLSVSVRPMPLRKHSAKRIRVQRLNWRRLNALLLNRLLLLAHRRVTRVLIQAVLESSRTFVVAVLILTLSRVRLTMK